MRMRLLVPVLLPAAALLSCAPAIKTPEVRLRSVALKSMQETSVILAVYNPNGFPLRVQSVDYEVSVGDRLCGKGRRSEPLSLNARDTTDAEFGLAMDWNSLGEAIPSLFTDSVELRVKGSYAVSTAFGRRRFGFDVRRTASVKDEVRSFIENLFGQ